MSLALALTILAFLILASINLVIDIFHDIQYFIRTKDYRTAVLLITLAVIVICVLTYIGIWLVYDLKIFQ
jgi:hypothetical protein